MEAPSVKIKVNNLTICSECKHFNCPVISAYRFLLEHIDEASSKFINLNAEVNVKCSNFKIKDE